jgi:hypothetical protein
MRVRSTRLRSATRMAKSRALADSAALANFRASETLTLARASKSSHQLRLSPRRRKHLSACWTRVRAAHRRTRRAMRDPGESPDLQVLILKQRPGRTCGAGVHTRSAYESDRGLHLADGTLFWVVWPTLRGSQVARLPFLISEVPRPACAFGAKSLKGDY